MEKLIVGVMVVLSSTLWAAPQLGNYAGIAFSGATHWRAFELSPGAIKNCESKPGAGNDFQICELENASFRYTSDGPAMANPFAGKTQLVYMKDSSGRWESYHLRGTVDVTAGTQTVPLEFRISLVAELVPSKNVVEGTIKIGDDQSGFTAKRVN